jgi:cation diffusion facilitator family transporter
MWLMTHHTTLFPERDAHDEREHRRAANRAVTVSAVVLGAAAVVELVFAGVTRSVGLLGDGLHNLSDVSTSALVYVGFRMSRRPPTERYPYGYDRAEDLAGLGVALVIWASAVFAGWQSITKLLNRGTTDHLDLGAAAAVVAIGANRFVAGYKARTGTRIQSATLLADARHSWLDAISSLGALVGIGAVAAGLSWGDPVAGLAVTVFIGHVGWEVTRDLGHRLMDGSELEVARIAESSALLVPDVSAASARARWAGRTLTVDIDITLDANISIGEAEHIAHATRLAVFHHLPAVRAVNVRATPPSVPRID